MKRHLPPWLLEARTILQEPDGDLPITRLAAQVGVHPVYLARRFRQHMRCSPVEYRLRCRLRRAMEQMLRGESSILQIGLPTRRPRVAFELMDTAEIQSPQTAF